MLRVLAITNMYPTPQHPGAGTFVEQQVVGLRRIGLEIEVMLINRAEIGMSSYFSMGAELQDRINRLQPDIVHVMYGGVMAERVTHMVKDRPTVVSFCGSDLLGEYLSGSLRRIISEWGIFASHIAAGRAAGIIVKSQNLEDALPSTVPRSKVRIIPNGIDLERFKPMDQVGCRQKLGWNPTKFHVLFPVNASDDPRKRPQLAQAAVDVARRSGLDAEMHQLRRVPHGEVPTWLNASDLVLLTSLHEGSPNIIKEALACNVPVVSVSVGDVGERIKGVEGCHLALPDPHDLGDKVGLVGARGARVAGRERVQHLSLEQTARNIESFYRDVLESHRKQGARSGGGINANALLEFFLSIRTRRKKFGG